MADPQAVRWLDQPEDHEHPAAASILALLAAPFSPIPLVLFDAPFGAPAPTRVV